LIQEWAVKVPSRKSIVFAAASPDDEHATTIGQAVNGILLDRDIAVGAGCQECKRPACVCAPCAKSFE
jgi:hypothetical protein